MAEKEIHTVGLGQVRKVAPRRRAGKAMKLVKEYVRRHSGVERVSVSNALNEHLWADGARNPPRNVEVQVLVDDGTAHVELADREFSLPEEEDEAAEEVEAAELTDEELAEKNVDEVKELVDGGAVDPQRALDVEYAGKNRKTLIEWLQDRIGGAESTDEAEEEPVAEPAEDGADEAPDKTATDEEPETDETEESADETYDLPDDVIETFEEGTIAEGKEAGKELGKQELEKLLNFEEAHQNRKGMKKWLRSNMN